MKEQLKHILSQSVRSGEILHDQADCIYREYLEMTKHGGKEHIAFDWVQNALDDLIEEKSLTVY